MTTQTTTRRTAAAVAVAAALLLAGCGAGAQPAEAESAPQTFWIIGVLDLHQVGLDLTEGDQCEGNGGYSDVKPGAQIKITDSTGAIIKLGDLGNGHARDNYPSLQGTDVCQFGIVVNDIPDEGDGVYGIEVANRGIVNFEKEGDSASVAIRLG